MLAQKFKTSRPLARITAPWGVSRTRSSLWPAVRIFCDRVGIDQSCVIEHAAVIGRSATRVEDAITGEGRRARAPRARGPWRHGDVPEVSIVEPNDPL